jgi:peptide/nickel transport system permease protein
MLRAFVRAPTGIIGLSILALLLVLACFAPPLLGERATAFDPSLGNQGPALNHLLGTDRLGRDILLRLAVATRLTLGFALLASLFGAVTGMPVGAFASILPGRLRLVALRAIDALIAFPALLIAIFVTAVVGAGAFGVTLGVGIAVSFGFARVASALALSISGREYFEAARVLGISRSRRLFRYVLPNMAEALAIISTVSISTAIVSIASLSFLGLGVQSPQFDWGSMLTDGVQELYEIPSAAIGPMVAIAIAALAFGFVGEALARAMNPVLWARGKGGATATMAAAGGVPGRAVGAIAQMLEADGIGVQQERAGQATGSAPDRVSTQNAGSKEGVLEVKHLSVSFAGTDGDIPIVDDVSFTLRKGEMVGLVGESGSGKTMTAMAIAQLIPFPGKVSGTVKLNDRDLRRLPIHDLDQLLGTQLAVVFQDPMSSLNPALRLGTQMTERVEVHGHMRHRAAKEFATRTLGEVHIPVPERQLGKHPHELSGGMRQRVMIAMGLMTQPALLIADEPTTALDVTIQAQIMDLLALVNERHGAAIILISHNLGLVSQNCRRIFVMYAGRVVEDISTEQLLAGAKHPYTIALLAAVPDMKRQRTIPLQSIPGQAPDLASAPSGCPYHPRCSFAVDICRLTRPALRARPNGDRVACHVANQDLL